ncbi:MAG: type II toxin-antitoxin system Phd/YefM family antitoxin [Acidimicrobiia bacterium]
MASESLRTVRDRFSEFIDRVHSHHERVTVTRNGTPAAVLISPEDLESLEETAAVLGDSDAVAELVDAHRAYLEGDVVRGVDAVKALRPR